LTFHDVTDNGASDADADAHRTHRTARDRPNAAAKNNLEPAARNARVAITPWRIDASNTNQCNAINPARNHTKDTHTHARKGLAPPSLSPRNQIKNNTDTQTA
jgi:hypothetical protein